MSNVCVRLGVAATGVIAVQATSAMAVAVISLAETGRCMAIWGQARRSGSEVMMSSAPSAKNNQKKAMPEYQTDNRPVTM